MTLSPRVKLLFLVGGIVLIGRVWISLIFSLGDNSGDVETDDFAANIQDALPEKIDTQTDEVDTQPDTDIQEQVVPTHTPEQNQQQNVGSSLTIIAPPFLSKEQWSIIQASIDNKSQQKTRLLYYPTRELYTQAAAQTISGQNTHDILILPSFWFESLVDTSLVFTLSERIRSVFHPMTHPRLFHESMSIVPFSLDPFVIFSHDADASYTSTTEIIQHMNTDKHSFTFTPTKLTGAPTREYFSVGHLVNTALIDAARSGAKRRVSFILLGAVLDIESGCNGTLSRCSFVQHSSQATIGPLSLLSQVDIPATLHPLPGDPETYPVISRGFTIPLSSDNQTAAAQWLSSYIELSSQGEIPYPQYVFAASMRSLQRQRIEEQFQTVNVFFDTTKLMVGALDDIVFTHENLVGSFLRQELSLDQLLQKIGDRL